MKPASGVSSNSNSVSAEKWITECWQEMQRRLSLGQDVSAGEHLASAPNSDAAVDVIYAEFILRVENGEEPSAEAFIARFPDYSNALRRQFALDRALSSIDETDDDTVRDKPAAVGNAAMPRQIGKYAIIAKLATGGQADVYRAVHPELNHEVVIKIAKPHRTSIDQDQIVSEGRVLVELDHPNLGRVFDVDLHEGRAFLVSHYIRGATLDRFVCQGKLDSREIAGMLADVARGLSCAHRQGVSHLDIKPRNIVVSESGKARLIDFGLAITERPFEDPTQLESGSLRGTVPFMSPEQASGDVDMIGPQCDVFGIGAVLYFALVGRAPYAEHGFVKNLEKARQGEWDRKILKESSAPKRLQNIVETALHPDPALRFRNCEEFADALEQYARSRMLSRRTALVGGALPILAVTAILWGTRSSNLGSIPANGPFEPSRVTVEVFHSGRFVNLAERMPVRTGDRLRISAPIPPKVHGSLFLLSADGEIQELRYVSPQSSGTTMSYPERLGQAVPLVGASGTEVVFLCLTRDHPVTLEDMRQAGVASIAFPELPELSVIVSDARGVHVEQSDRSLGAPEDLPDPEQVVVRQLELMRDTFSTNGTAFSAIAFHHSR